MGVVAEELATGEWYDPRFARPPQLIFPEPMSSEYPVQGVIVGADKSNNMMVSHLILSSADAVSVAPDRRDPTNEEKGDLLDWFSVGDIGDCKTASGKTLSVMPLHTRKGALGQFALSGMPTLHEALSIYGQEDAEHGRALPPAVVTKLQAIAAAHPEQLPFRAHPELEAQFALLNAHTKLFEWGHQHRDVLQASGLNLPFEELNVRLRRMSTIVQTARFIADKSKDLRNLVDKPEESGPLAQIPYMLQEGSMKSRDIPCEIAPVALRTVKQTAESGARVMEEAIAACRPELDACVNVSERLMAGLRNKVEANTLAPILADLRDAAGYAEMLQKKRLDKLVGRGNE